MGKGYRFNKWCWENGRNTYRTVKLEPYFTSLIKINSKWIKDLNIRPEIVKLPEENIGKQLIGILVLEMIFLYLMPKAQKKKKIMNIWDYLKLKSFCTARETT